MSRIVFAAFIALLLGACGSSAQKAASSATLAPGATTPVTTPRVPIPPSSYTGPAPGPTDHWHAALGVYLCDHWQGGAHWPWPAETSHGNPGRVGTDQYAGLHSHGDGIIHIEPLTTDEMGVHATVGTYFTFGGWQLSPNVVSFLGQTEHNGDRCGNGAAGTVRWSVNGAEHHGSAADYRIADGDSIVIAFVPGSVQLSSLGPPPALRNLTLVAPIPSPPPIPGQRPAPSPPPTG